MTAIPGIVAVILAGTLVLGGLSMHDDHRPDVRRSWGHILVACAIGLGAMGVGAVLIAG